MRKTLKPLRRCQGRAIVLATKSYVTQSMSVYLTGAELARKGFVVAVTSRNAPGVDLMVTSSDMKRTYGLQVKGNHWGGTQTYWLTSARARKDVGDRLFYVFVNLKRGKNRPDFYVVPSRVVSEKVETDGQFHWFNRDDAKAYLEKWGQFA